MKGVRDKFVDQFFDLEARVDDRDEEEDEDDGDDEGFIQDDPSIDNQYTPQRHSTDVDEGGWIASLEERYASTHRVAEGNRNEGPHEGHPITSFIDKISRLPTNDDYSLWRVRCKPGLEEEVVLSLLQLAAPRHELRSAFANSRVVKGWVYLETTMNKNLGELLTITPGVIRDRWGLVYQFIERSEGLQLLNVDSDMQIASGQWVKVRRGIYKGDVGHVMTTQGSSIQLLLVPRLPLPKAIGIHTQTHPTPTLFDHETVKQVYGTEPVRINENVYSFQGKTFEHGLIVKEFPLNLVSTTVSSMPLHLFNLFRESLHPNLKARASTFPKPSEWCFAEGDEVYIQETSPPKPGATGISRFISSTSYIPGTISIVRSDSVDVTTKEGIVNVPWLDIRKAFHEGDFVEITGGMYQGQTGWVVTNPDSTQVVTIVLQCEEKETLLTRMEIEAHVNLLKHAVVPHVLGTHPHPWNALPRSERIPWINTAVVVTGRHSMRTYPGIVKSVLTGQQTPSGLKLQIQPTHVDPNTPFSLLTLDYDNVVEASRGIKLYDYARSTSQIFTPKNWAPLQLPPILIRKPSFESMVRCNSTPGFATPFPEPSLSSSPAWNPDSDIPDTNHLVGSPDRLPDPSFHHPLLDERLLNVHLQVIVTGGGFDAKELTACVQSIDGRLRLRQIVYKTSTELNEEWVTPKHPNPTRDHGLLIVIKGDHCGKHVRRIHHRYESKDYDASAIVILAVVDRVAGHMDKLTGERLELDVSYLGVCKESKGDKARNSSLMNALREEARAK